MTTLDTASSSMANCSSPIWKCKPGTRCWTSAAVFGADSPLAKPITYKLDRAELDGLLGQVGLEVTRLEIRTFDDCFASVDEVMDFQISSSFGNAFADLAPDDREQARAALDRGLDGYRLPEGAIRLRHTNLFAVACKH